MDSTTSLSDVQQQFEQSLQNGNLILSPTLSPADSLTRFLVFLPGRQLTLQGAALTLDSQANTLQVAGNVGTLWPVIGIGSGVQVGQVTLLFTGGGKVQLTAEGIVSIGTAQIELTGTLDDTNLLTFALKNQDARSLSLTDTANFISNNALAAYLPTFVDIFDTVPLTALTLAFGFERTSVTHCSYTSNINADWTIIDGFAALQKVGLTLDTFYFFDQKQGFQARVGGNIHATLHIEQDFAVILALQGPNYWEVELLPADGNVLPGLQTLAGLVGGADLQQGVQAGLQKIGLDALAIDAVRIAFDLPARKLLTISLNGHITLDGLTFYIQTSLPHFAFYGELSPTTPIHLATLLGQHLADTHGFPDIEISSLTLGAQPGEGCYSLYVSILVPWTFTVGNIALGFEDLDFEITRTPTGTTGYLEGHCTIANASISIMAQHMQVGAGWQFSGSLAGGTTLPLGNLIAGLATTFGTDTNVPAALEGLTIRTFDVEFDTLTKNFTFACETTFALDNQTIDLVVTISVTQDGSGKYAKTFGGTITIGTREFTLLFSEDATSTFFLATYTNPGGDKLRIKEDLVAPLSPTVAADIPEGLEIDFKDVLFVFSKGAKGTTPTFVLGLDLGVNIPSLSNLPLVGQMLPADQTISVNNLRVLIASQALTADVLTLINGLLTSGIAPLPTAALKQGLTLAAALNFGGTPQMLTVPVAGASPTPTPTPAVSAAGTTTTDNATWFSLQKSFGPVHFNRVGVQYQDAAIWFLLDAALSLAGLTLSLEGLSFGSPLSKFVPEFQLRGLGLDYQEGPVEIGGAFLHVREKLPSGATLDEYEGLAIIKTEELTLSALGAYADLAGNPSLFIYAVLDYPLGGPTFFFITGLAAGFGYNRALIVPPIEQVNQFPLVVDAVGGAIPAQNAQDLGAELAKFDQYITPELGEIFFAIGIRYTSFKLIDSFALLTVAFGNELEVDVLGLSTLILPTPVPDVPNPTPLAVVQMAVKASYIPALGFLGVSAQLTTASYLLSSSCHLTGGFAFYSWLSGEHAGDFVQTLGGYHPAFVVPSHYPTVPRLGFQWQVDDSISIKGEAYCALTASALMAGMHVQATWHSGDFSAWFNAAFDFLLSWKPFHYDISLSIDLGASYTFTFFGTHTISVDVGADLHIWGPEFSGTAHVNLSIISFDVSFGANASHIPTPIDWPTFKKSFLPADSAVVGVSVKAGLVSKQSADATDLGVLDPRQFALVTNTMVPATHAHIQQDMAITQPLGPIAIGSMGVQVNELVSTHTITITKDGTNVEQHFTFTPVLKSAPVGLWGHSLTPDLNGPRFIDNALTGFEITPAASPAAGATAVIDTGKLRYEAETVASAYDWTLNPSAFQADALDDAGSRQKISATLTAPAVSAARLQLLTQLGLDAASIDLSAASTLIDGFVIAPQIEKI